MATDSRQVIPFEEINRSATAQVGGKNASLGEMVCHLEEKGVAVRSSATAEDLLEASFAGQQESFLNRAPLRQCRDAFPATRGT